MLRFLSCPPRPARLGLTLLGLLLLAAGARAQPAPPPPETTAPPGLGVPAEAAPTVALPGPGAPAVPTPPADNTEQRLAELERRQAAVEQQQAAARPSAASSGGLQLSGGPGRGYTLSAADGRFSATLRARGQLRDTLTAATNLTNELNVKTIRLYLSGNILAPELKYFLQLALGGGDFEAGSSSPLFDFWVEYTRLRDLNIRVGQFFVPFDRARTVREFALQLVDRPQVVSELSLDRDVGIMLSSTNLFGSHDILSYNLGVFGGKGRNRFGGGVAGFLYVLRFSVRPLGAFDDDQEGDLLRLRRPRLMIGVAGAYNQNTDRQRSTVGNVLTLGNLDYGHFAADTVFKYAGFSFLGEVLYRQARSDYFDGMSNGKPLREWSRSAFGYLLQAAVMLTGKLELVTRWESLLTIDPTDPALQTLVQTQGKQLGGGVNLYLSGHLFKVQADYFYQFGDDLAAGRQVARLQLDATF